METGDSKLKHQIPLGWKCLRMDVAKSYALNLLRELRCGKKMGF